MFYLLDLAILVGKQTDHDPVRNSQFLVLSHKKLLPRPVGGKPPYQLHERVIRHCHSAVGDAFISVWEVVGASCNANDTFLTLVIIMCQDLRSSSVVSLLRV